jgi:hypothetical protein
MTAIDHNSEGGRAEFAEADPKDAISLGSFFRTMILFCRSSRPRSGRHSEALNTAGSIATDDRSLLRALV